MALPVGLLIGIVSSVGCLLAPSAPVTVAPDPNAEGLEHEAVEGIRIVKASEVSDVEYRRKSVRLGFGDGQDGTEAIIELLRTARARGAEHLSDIETRLVTRRDDGWVQCVTRLALEGEQGVRVDPVVEPGKTERRYVSKPVRRTVTEYEYRCRSVTKPVQRMVTRYESQYDPMSKRTVSKPVSRYETRYESRQECRNEPVTRTVTRYEYQYETRYIPPRLRYLVQHYTDWSLRELEPECEATDEPADASKPHVVSATMYLRRQ